MLKGAKGLFLMLGAVALFVFVAGMLVKTNNGGTTFLSPYFSSLHFGNSPTPAPAKLTDLKKITIGKTSLMVQFADTDAERQKGLGGISSLPAGQGMLFVFNSKQILPSFWMKDMEIPLDFIWISNGKVSEITPNVANPAPGTADKDLKVYTPSMAIDYVLEVNAGFSKTNNIKVGDTVLLNL